MKSLRPKYLLQPMKPILRPAVPLYYRLRYGALGKYIAYSRSIPGWTAWDEAVALARMSYELPADAIVVEIGSFLGRSAVLLAGARKLRGNGKVHCIDPFDASGDAYSVPFYLTIATSKKMSLRQRFDDNIRRIGLSAWIEVHQGTASTVAETWKEPIDMLFLDGDQSPAGVRSAYEQWEPFLKCGGIIAVHNSADRIYQESHDGHRRLVVETIRPPQYEAICCIGTTTFAKMTDALHNSIAPVAG